MVERALWEREVRRFKSCHPDHVRPWSNWIRHPPSKRNDGGSIPSGRMQFAPCHPVGIAARYATLMICGHCALDRPDDWFRLRDRRTGRIDTICVDCRRGYGRAYYDRDPVRFNARRRARMATYRARNREYVESYLRAHPCVDCGIAEIVVLEFDHVRGSKVNNISCLVRDGARMEKLQEEIAKCVVRCANCHRRRTNQEIWTAMRKRKSSAGTEISLLPGSAVVVAQLVRALDCDLRGRRFEPGQPPHRKRRDSVLTMESLRLNVGRPGLEPGTNSLKGYCSTIELPSR